MIVECFNIWESYCTRKREEENTAWLCARFCSISLKKSFFMKIKQKMENRSKTMKILFSEWRRVVKKILSARLMEIETFLQCGRRFLNLWREKAQESSSKNERVSRIISKRRKSLILKKWHYFVTYENEKQNWPVLGYFAKKIDSPLKSIIRRLLLRLWRIHSNRTLSIKHAFFIAFRRATVIEYFQQLIIVRYARNLQIEVFKNWRSVLKESKAKKIQSITNKRLLAETFKALRACKDNSKEIVHRLSTFKEESIKKTYVIEWLLLIRSNHKAVSNRRVSFAIWRALSLRQGTKFWMAVRHRRLHVIGIIFSAWYAHCIFKLRKRFISLKLFNMACKRSVTRLKNGCLRAWMVEWKANHMCKHALLLRAIIGWGLYVNHRRSKVSMLLCYDSPFQQKLFSLCHAESARLYENKENLLKLAVIKEKSRIITKARTLKLWQDSVNNFMRSFRN